MNGKKKKIIFGVSLVLLLAGLVYLIVYFVQKKENHQVYDDIQKENEVN